MIQQDDNITLLLIIRYELLRVWKRETQHATYKDLLKVCVDTENKDSAKKIIEVLRGKLG